MKESLISYCKKNCGMLWKMVSYKVYAVHDVLHMGYYPLRHNVQSGLNFINATRVMTKSLLGA